MLMPWLYIAFYNLYFRPMSIYLPLEGISVFLSFAQFVVCNAIGSHPVDLCLYSLHLRFFYL